MTDSNSNPAEIERELAETRARLDAHLDELTSRLSPGQMLDDGLNYLRHGQGAEFARNLGTQLRDNPLPVAVTGIGLAWLMATSAWSMNRGSRSPVGPTTEWPGTDAYDDIAARAQRAGDAVTRLAGETEDAFQLRVGQARAQILGLQRDAAETAAVFLERVQQSFASAQQTARERLAQLGDAASQWGSSVADRTRRTGEAWGAAAQQGGDMAAKAAVAIGEAVKQNPILLGAVGLTAGVMLAAFLPATEQEEALVAPMGEAMQRAAGEVMERGKRAAEAAADAAYQEVVAEE